MDWDELYSACMDCHGCDLADTRTNVVFGVGSRASKLVFIGEGPGEQEDIKGEPFVGRAGNLLDDELAIIGLDRSKVYICNIVKCRPPHNRDPLNTEQDACAKWLEAQMALLQPKIVVCLGRIAAGALISPDFRITRQHGQWFEKDGIKYMAMYHPAALLRDESKRPETFVDLKTLQRELISHDIL